MKRDIHDYTTNYMTNINTTMLTIHVLLGSVMVAVVLLSRRWNINPDNIATPIAASLGDLTTLSLLAGLSKILFHTLGKKHTSELKQ